MELLKSYMRQTATMIDESADFAHVYFKDFGTLEFEKYVSLRQRESAKKTWFFRLDFLREERTARYLFFFGYLSFHVSSEYHVTLHISREEPPGSYHYERLSSISAPNVPTITEIGYDSKSERFNAFSPNGPARSAKIEQLGKDFFDQVIKLHFST